MKSPPGNHQPRTAKDSRVHPFLWRFFLGLRYKREEQTCKSSISPFVFLPITYYILPLHHLCHLSGFLACLTSMFHQSIAKIAVVVSTWALSTFLVSSLLKLDCHYMLDNQVGDYILCQTGKTMDTRHYCSKESCHNGGLSWAQMDNCILQGSKDHGISQQKCKHYNWLGGTQGYSCTNLGNVPYYCNMDPRYTQFMRCETCYTLWRWFCRTITGMILIAV